MEKYLNDKMAIIIFAVPTLAIFTLMVMYPVSQIFIKSLYEWDGVSQPIFIGMRNFVELFDDKIFHISIKNGLIFAVLQTIFQVVVGTLLALAVIDVDTKCKRFLRVSYFIPVVLSITVVCQLWLSILNPETGLFNMALRALGINYQQEWLSNEKSAIYAVIFTNSWQYAGYHFILLLTAAKSIPEHFFEAATIDGCTSWKAHWKITIPLMAESYKFCIVLAVTGGLNAFANIYIMTGGGPGNATYTLTYLMNRAAFRINQYGYGSASAVLLVIECLIATVIINRLVSKEPITY